MHLVLCGSMKFKQDILELAKTLESFGHQAEIPEECIAGLPKTIASRAHFNRIIKSETEAILVVNNQKGDIKNYIGPNSFAEIAFAFFYNKKIFLLNDIYSPYEDELLGWGAIPLNNNLERLK